jgi:hypothetical protein
VIPLSRACRTCGSVDQLSLLIELKVSFSSTTRVVMMAKQIEIM